MYGTDVDVDEDNARCKGDTKDKNLGADIISSINLVKIAFEDNSMEIDAAAVFNTVPRF